MLRPLFRTAFQPFPGPDATAAILFGVVAGAALALAFRWAGQRQKTRELRRKLWAHVLELRLFGDDPSLAVTSLAHIIRINVTLLCYALPPLLLAAPVVLLLLAQLNDFFTSTPLAQGRDAVLTVRFRGALPPSDSVRLETPSWIAIDAPPVHIPASREISWRIRPAAAALGICKITVSGETLDKEVDSRPGRRYSGRVRARGWLDAISHPAEERLPEGPVDRVWISPEPSTVPWFDWFAATASLAAWLFSIPLARLRRVP